MSETRDSFYSDPAWGGGGFFRFENVGDNVKGNIVEVKWHTFEAKDDREASTVPVLVLEQADGTLIDVTCSNADLKAQMRLQKPFVGDYVGIKFSRQIGVKKLFDVFVRAGQPLKATAEQQIVNALAAGQDVEIPF